jgi:EAL domain-containing protein (putative c-di-GMP-specific phosphodiesterase class I)
MCVGDASARRCAAVVPVACPVYALRVRAAVLTAAGAPTCTQVLDLCNQLVNLQFQDGSFTVCLWRRRRPLHPAVLPVCSARCLLQAEALVRLLPADVEFAGENVFVKYLTEIGRPVEPDRLRPSEFCRMIEKYCTGQAHALLAADRSRARLTRNPRDCARVRAASVVLVSKSCRLCSLKL